MAEISHTPTDWNDYLTQPLPPKEILMSEIKLLSNFMIDIETLGVEPDTVILSIGAVKFDSKFFGTASLYAELSTKGQCRSVNISTVRWWAEQETKIPGDCSDARTLKEALTELSEFIAVNSVGTTPIIWCKGPQFDAAILTHAYESLDMEVPWKYNSVRDVRTLMKIAGVASSTTPTHNAYQDCVDQIASLRHCFEFLALPLPTEEIKS